MSVKVWIIERQQEPRGRWSAITIVKSKLAIEGALKHWCFVMPEDMHRIVRYTRDKNQPASNRI